MKEYIQDGQRRFRAYLAVFQLLRCLEKTHSGQNLKMLDVGGGHGIHARFFRKKGITVDIVDIQAGDSPLIFKGNYLDYVTHPYDIVWASHVLEHVPNVRIFLRKLVADTKRGGYLCITVPPIKENRMAYDHLTLWNPGILLLNLAHAGLDPSTAQFAQYGYNISCIIRKSDKVITPSTKWIKSSFPPQMQVTKFHFSGDIKRYHWQTNIKCMLEMEPDIIKKDNVIYYYDRKEEAVYVLR